MLRFPVLAIFISLGIVHGWREKRDTVVDKGDYTLVCRGAPIEVGIVLDTSSSIHENDFKKGLVFLKDFLKQFDLGDSKHNVRVAVIPYDSRVHPSVGFKLSSYKSKKDILNAIGKIRHQAGSSTHTWDAIDYLRGEAFRKNRVRPQAAKVGIVITDGRSQDPQKTKAAALKARKDNITMVAVGVGQHTDRKELLRIAGVRSRVLMADSYSSLSSIKKHLTATTCVRKDKPKTDVYFIFSPCDLSINAIQQTNSFISHTVNSKLITEGYKFEVITDDCGKHGGFPLSDKKNWTDILAYLKDFDHVYIPELAQQLLDQGFSSKNGTRTGAREVAVLFTSFIVGDLEAKVKALHDHGIEVFHLQPAEFVTKQISVNGTVKLTGKNAAEKSDSLIAMLKATKN